MRIWALIPLSITRRRVPLAAIAPVLTVIAAVISLWMHKPWEENFPDLPMPPGAPGPTAMRGMPGPPRIPPPIPIEKEWEADRSTITPGEPVTVTLTLRNVLDERIEITAFPSVATLNQINVDGKEQIEVELKRTGGASTTLEPGEEFTAIADITSDMSAVLPPGIYGIRLDVSIERGLERRASRLGFSMGSFVIIPPEGTLDATVIVDRAREANGVRVTLERLDFSPERSTVTVFAASPPSGRGVSAPDNALMPAATATAVSRPPGIPTSVPASGPIIGVYPDLTARYRVGEGAWRELRQYSYREAPEGVHREWTFGPVSANAESFELAIESVAHPESDAVLTWEWVVLLRK